MSIWSAVNPVNLVNTVNAVKELPPPDGVAPAGESNVRRRRTRGFWTVLTRLTGLTVLTADSVDEIDVVEPVIGFNCFDCASACVCFAWLVVRPSNRCNGSLECFLRLAIRRS
ncbi:MAG: hypothetical protein ACK6DQ_19625 [Planctomycetota bacterium]